MSSGVSGWGRRQTDLERPARRSGGLETARRHDWEAGRVWATDLPVCLEEVVVRCAIERARLESDAMSVSLAEWLVLARWVADVVHAPMLRPRGRGG